MDENKTTDKEYICNGENGESKTDVDAVDDEDAPVLDEDIVSGKKYYYKVKAIYDSGESNFSNMDSGYSILDNVEYSFDAAFGETGNDDGQFNNPTGITLDKEGNVFVVDSGNNRIQKFKPISQ